MDVSEIMILNDEMKLAAARKERLITEEHARLVRGATGAMYEQCPVPDAQHEVLVESDSRVTGKKDGTKMGDGYYCGVNDQDERNRLKSLGVMDTAFMTDAEFAEHKLRSEQMSGKWVAKCDYHWEYEDHRHRTSGRLTHQGFRSYAFNGPGWILGIHFPRPSPTGLRETMYHSADAALAAFDAALVKHFQAIAEGEANLIAIRAEDAQRGKSLRDEVSAALSRMNRGA